MATDSLMIDQPNIVKPLFELSGKLLIQMNALNQPGNVIMSPVSIHQALSMVLLGSDNNSETKREILDTIGYSNMSEDDIERCHQDYAKVMSDFARVSERTRRGRKEDKQKGEEGVQEPRQRCPIFDLITMMIIKNGTKANPKYEQNIKKYFHASISNIDDEKPETKADLLEKLNGWARESGFEGPIMDDDYLNGVFGVILLSAIQVEGFWFEAFAEGIANEIFFNHGSKDNPVAGEYLSAKQLKGSRFLEFTQKEFAQIGDLHVHMSKDESFNKLSSLNFRAIDVPLQGGLRLAMFEPISVENDASDDKPTAKLEKLVESLFSSYEGETQNSDNLTNLAKAFKVLAPQNSNEIDHLRIPKFKFESDIDLKSILTSVGLKRVFEMQNAELSNITNRNLCIDDIKHKAVIETTQAGIKAAGVTIIKMFRSCGPFRGERKTPIVVRVENPFMFVLRYQRMPLFVGQLTNV